MVKSWYQTRDGFYLHHAKAAVTNHYCSADLCVRRKHHVVVSGRFNKFRTSLVGKSLYCLENLEHLTQLKAKWVISPGMGNLCDRVNVPFIMSH